MANADILNSNTNLADGQANSLASTSIKEMFFVWLAEGNARKYSPAALLSSFDSVSEHMRKKKISSVNLWELTRKSDFTPIYTKLMRTRLFRIMEKNTYKIFTVAGQLYLQFLKEKTFGNETTEDKIVVTVPSTGPAMKRLFTKKADWSLFNYGFAVPQSSASAFFEAIGTELNSSNTKANIALKFNGKLYQAHAVAYGKSLQVRWGVNDDIAIELRNVFSKCYEQIKAIKAHGVGNLSPEQSIYLDVTVAAVCGQLELAVSAFPKTKSISTEPINETLIENNEIPQITSQQSEINSKDVIAWLVTQPNINGSLYLENVVLQYMSALRSAPAKLQIFKTVNRNVFDCHTVDELNALWDAFMTASNYKQVNASTSGAFSAGMRCLSRYLEHLSNENRNEQQPNQEHFRVKKNKTLSSGSLQGEFDLSVIDKLTKVLTKRFSNGFRIDSPIELARFRSFAFDDFGEDVSLTDEDLRTYISVCGTVFDGKIYAVSSQTKSRIKALADAYFESGAKAIFYAEFYTKNENWLFGASVVSEDMLIGILRELFPMLSFTQTYFGYADVSVFATLESEILRVWGDDVLLTYEQLAERLQYIPIDRIKYALGQNGDFIWSSAGTFSHVSRIEVTETERGVILEAAVRKCNALGYTSITDLPFGEIVERNDQLSTAAVHNAVYRICLSDKFDKKGKIVTRKGDVFDALTIMKEYCRTINKCSLDDLLNFEKELTGEVHRWIPMEAGNTILVRINKDTYVADKYVHFNADVIDDAIGLFVKGDYLPLKSFTTFGAFPDCGQGWNWFLLESYCRRFSRKFRFDTPSVNSRSAGAVIRKSCGMDYTEIMTDAVAKADIPLKDSAVGKFLYENGYTGRSATAKANEIIDKAKAIREMRD